MRAIFLILCLSSPAFASVVNYNFSGANGLAGSFTLDADTPFSMTPDGICGTLESSLNHIAGNFGSPAFQGTPLLSVCNPTSDFSTDWWIVRSVISGDAINGKAPALLNLFIYRVGVAHTPISLTPPEHNNTLSEFQYTLGFTDGSFIGGGLNSLAIADTAIPAVPEPCVGTLLGIGLFILGGAVRYKTRGLDARAD
jgi:hypothetical protein